MFYKRFISILIVVIILLGVMNYTFALTLNDLKKPSQRNSVLQLHQCGLEKLHENNISRIPNSKKPVMGAIPSSIDHSSKLPPVGNQGNQGSCVAWATGYYYKSFQEAKDWGWSVSYYKNWMSPAYIYNQIHLPTGGCYIGDAFNLIQDQGTCRDYLMPYDASDDTTQPNQNQTKNAALYEAKYYYNLTSGNVNSLRNWLASGDLAVLAIPVSSDFDNIGTDYADGERDIYDIYDSDHHRGNHAITLCGYDDSKQAFKFVNSWGKDWGLSGYGWISYNLVSLYSWDSYVMQDVNNGHKITLKSAKLIKNYHQGSQWSYKVSKINNSYPNIPVGKYVYTRSDKVYIKVVEDDGAASNDDIVTTTKTLKNGDNVIDVKCYENHNHDYYGIWRFVINKRD